MRRLWLVPALALVLSACSVEPRDELRGEVEAVTLAANSGDAAGLRDAVAELRTTIRRQVAGGDLPRAEGERLNAIALRILENADLLEQPPASPTPVQTEEEPEPEPTPTEVEEEEPEPEPTQEEPQEPVEPEPEATIEVEPFPDESPPTQQSQAGPSSSPRSRTTATATPST